MVRAFIGVVGVWTRHVAANDAYARAVAPVVSVAAAVAVSSLADAAEAERRNVPHFAKAMGHEDMCKLHNNCK